MCETDQKTVPVRDAVGLVLGHDITAIDPRTGFKGCRFRRGHVITENDIDKLLSLGKENIYVLKVGAGQLHEDDAVRQLADAIAGPGTHFVPEPREGRINILASIPGLLKVNTTALERFNLVEAVMCATRHSNTAVAAGDIVAGTRAIPLLVDKEPVREAAALAGKAGGLVSIVPLKQARAAVIITGNEVYTGRIDDAFEPVIRQKLEELGSEVHIVVKCPDDVMLIRDAVIRAHDGGADLVIITGGMSVDPDDVTPQAAREAGAEITSYGSSVLPGAMFMTAYLKDGTPVLGVPACGIHHPRTIFDLILPRVLSGEKITDREIARLGHGGLCLDCKQCRFPVCPFGKGS